MFRWLLSTGNQAEAAKILRKAAKTNGRGRDIPDGIFDSIELSRGQEEDQVTLADFTFLQEFFLG